MTIREVIDTHYRECEFDAVGVAEYATLTFSLARLDEWVGKGYHGGMEYMARSLDRRDDIRCLMPDTRSVVATLSLYRPSVSQPDTAAPIAAFAWGDDYHTLIKGRLLRLLKIIQQHYPHVRGRAVVDSAPTFDREWAVRAGLGWVGRSSMVVNPQLGSYTIIGLLLLNVEVEVSAARVEDRCQGCGACLRACPSGAILDNRTIDARLCRSYQTIESGGVAEMADNSYIFGCDLCLEACPYNRAAPTRDLASPITLTTGQWMEMEKSEFEQRFKNSPLKRAGLSKIKSNIR